MPRATCTVAGIGLSNGLVPTGRPGWGRLGAALVSPRGVVTCRAGVRIPQEADLRRSGEEQAAGELGASAGSAGRGRGLLTWWITVPPPRCQDCATSLLLVRVGGTQQGLPGLL